MDILVKEMVIKGNRFYDGQHVSCIFTDNTTIHGTLYIEYCNSPHMARMFFCHSDRRRIGSVSPNLYGHKYSWVFEYNGRFTQDVKELIPINPSVSFKPSINISDSLSRFLGLFCDSQINLLFNLSVKPFEIYTDYDTSEKPGYIKIAGTDKRGSKKVVEVKIARFLKRILDNSEYCRELITLTDRNIEMIQNDLIAYSQSDYYTLGFYEGKEIEEAYKSSNYAWIGSGTLSKSCMSDRLSYLSIYTDNPKHVKVAYLRTKRGIEARCLIWTVDGVSYFDRIYYTQDWLESLMANKLRESGYREIYGVEQKPYLCIQLDKWKYEEYPYLDTFNYLNYHTGKIFAASDYTSIPYKFVRKLNSTRGAYELIRNNR